MRIDDYLALALKGCSKKVCAGFIKAGSVTVDDLVVIEPSFQCILGAGIAVKYKDSRTGTEQILKEPFHRLLVLYKPENTGIIITCACLQ